MREVMNFEDIRKMDDKKFCKWLEIIWKADYLTCQMGCTEKSMSDFYQKLNSGKDNKNDLYKLFCKIE